MSELAPPTPDFDAQLPYIIWDYYADCVGAGEMTLEEAKVLYLQDMDGRDGRV